MKSTLVLLLLLAFTASCAKKAGDSGSSERSRPGIGGSSGGENSTGGASGSSSGGTSTGGSSTGGESSSGGSTGGSSSSGGSSGGASSGGTTGGAETPTLTLFVGSNSEGRAGAFSTGFEAAVDMDSATEINFDNFKKGKASLLKGGEFLTFEFSTLEESKSHKPRKTFAEFFGKKTYRFSVEKPIKQNGVKGEGGGVDTGFHGITKRVVAAWKFSEAVSFFGATLIDLESSKKVQATLKAFNCSDELLEQLPIVYPNNETGNKQIHFVGVKSSEANICRVTITVGDSPGWIILHNGSLRGIAVDDFFYGQ